MSYKNISSNIRMITDNQDNLRNLLINIYHRGTSPRAVIGLEAKGFTATDPIPQKMKMSSAEVKHLRLAYSGELGRFSRAYLLYLILESCVSVVEKFYGTLHNHYNGKTLKKLVLYTTFFFQINHYL